ncbi:MAG: hypothetical protein HFH41_03895 [Lachnospiraceae bacterium]|nr:hypothetical protein [Lachnospiraceae bacterium]
MNMIKIDLSSFPPEKQKELGKKILALAWDDNITIGRPELLTVLWNQNESIESVFPELTSHLTYL